MAFSWCFYSPLALFKLVCEDIETLVILCAILLPFKSPVSSAVF